MVKHTLKRLPKSTIEIKLSVTWDKIQAEYEKSFTALQNELTVEGFRKGKAPKAIAEKHISKEDVYNHLVRSMLPALYDDVVKKENLKPIVSPKIELVKAKEKEDWEFNMTVAEKPEIDLGDYKKKIKETNSKLKKADIWVPGKDEKENKAKAEQDKQMQLNTILGDLLKDVKCEMSDLLVEEEVNNRLSRLLDDIQKLGLTADAYLKSKNTTMEELKKNIQREIEDTYKLEFILGEIAEKENITVEKKDIDALFAHITDEKERKAAEQNAYFYASVLRKQKTLDYLTSL